MSRRAYPRHPRVTTSGSTITRYGKPNPGEHLPPGFDKIRELHSGRLYTNNTGQYPTWRAAGISISPTTATKDQGATQQFTAIITNNDTIDVTWSAPDGGSVSSSGLFTAPATAGDYRVLATLDDDENAVAVAVVTVSAVAIQISPTTATVVHGNTQQFTATVTGSTTTTKTWSVVEGGSGGSVNGSGLYTSPATPGTYHVRATATADNTKTSTATVTVT